MEATAEEVQVVKYPAYKDSGVEWLGDIPAHWEVLKAKYLWKEKIELAQTEEETLLSVSQYLGVNNREVDSRSESLVGYKKVAENDLVINIMLAWLGGLGLSPLSGVVSPAYGVYQLLSEADSKFLHYLYRTSTYLDEFARRSRGVVPSRWRMYTDDFGQVLTLLPPKEEQTDIAQFLDRKTAQIDKAISIKEKQIALLKERRQVLIHNAVTRGLNPNAPLKDSGVEWIGEIPAHWEVTSVKHTLSTPITDGPHTTPELLDEGIPFISAEAIKNGEIDFDKKRGFISVKDHLLFSKKYSPMKGDIYMVKSGATTGNIAMVKTDEDFSIWSPLAVFRVNSNKVLADYLYIYLESPSFKKGVELSWSFGTQQNIGMGVLSNLPICYPTIAEQNEIINHVKASSTKISIAISCKEKEIEKLKEYKAILINSAVTGKIKVC